MKLRKKDKKRLKQLVYSEIYLQEQAACVPYEPEDVEHLKQLLKKLS